MRHPVHFCYPHYLSRRFCGTILVVSLLNYKLHMSHCQRRRKANFLRHICVWFVILALPLYGVAMAALWGQLISPTAKAVSFNFGENSNLQSPDFVAAKMAQMSLPFVPNRGQYEAQVRYSTQLFSGGVFFVTDNDLTYDFHGVGQDGKQDLAIKESFLNTKGFRITPQDQAPTVTSFFKGNDPSKWQSGLTTYNTLSLGALYPKIEVKLKASGKNVEKIFYVAPNGNPSLIASKLSGIKSLKVAEDGSLIIETVLGEVRQTKPVAYQETKTGRKNVDVAYVIKSTNTYGFVVGDYDRRLPLVIDPAFTTLLASSFLGTSANDSGYAIAVDSSGNVFITGTTSSADFPTTAGVYDTSYNSSADVFVSKFNSTLTQLMASTFLGGSSDDTPYALKIDNSDSVYLTGQTASSAFPTTAGVYDTSQNGGDDVFVSILNNTLTSLSASTFLGGTLNDRAYAMAIDGSGNIFVGGTATAGFPTTGGAYDTSSVSSDAFVAKFNSTLTSLSASTFIGGDTGAEGGWGVTPPRGMAIDGSGNVYAITATNFSDFPTTLGAYDRVYNDGSDTAIFELNNSLTSLVASTFLGGSATDEPNSMVLDGAGNVFLVGYTGSSNFPTTGGAYDTSYGGVDVFISKLDSGLTTLLSSTFFGSADYATFIGVDSANSIYITGISTDGSIPTTTSAYDTSYSSSNDGFVAKFNNTLTSLSASTFLGATGNDVPYSFTILSSGNVYVTGSTYSTDFPVTAGVYDSSQNGSSDVFLALVGDPTIQFTSTASSGSEATTSVNISVSLSVASSVNATVDYAVTGGTATGSGTDYTLAAGTATITAGNTTTNIPVTIVNDDLDESDETIIVTLSNPVSSNLGSNTIHTYTITDNDTTGVTVTESGGSTAVTEGGATDSYTVVLTSQPRSDVTITASPHSELSLSSTTLTFTSANWSTPQTVTVTAVNDSRASGSRSRSITHSAASTDAGYSGISVASVSVAITDNDTAGVTVTESGGSTVVTEGGATDTYTVVLTSQPTADVTITPSPNAQVSVSPTTLTFTAANWNSAQTVTVTAVDDSDIEGNHTGTVSHSASSSDTTYNGISIASLTPNITDNDRATGGSSPSNPIQQYYPPIGVTGLTGQALSATSVKWCFTDNANNESGFVLHGASENELGSASASSGVGAQACTIEENLSPNSQAVNRHIHAFNSMGTSPASETVPATWTLAVVPSAPTLSPIARDKILAVIAADSNSSLTEYAIFENLQQKWVQAGGDLGANPVWQTRAGWGGDNGVQITGLTASTVYEFKVKARNGAQVETDFSIAAGAKTLKGAPKLILHLTAKIIPTESSPAPVSYKGFWGFLRRILLAIIPDNVLAVVSQVKAQVTTVQEGDKVQFAATVENTGDEAATNVILTFPLPVGVTYDAGSMKVDGQIYPAEVKDSVLTVALAEVGPGVKKTLDWSGTITAKAAETKILPFQAQVQATEVPATVEPVKSEIISFDVAPPTVPFTVTPSEVLVNKKDQAVGITGPVGFSLTLCLSSDPSVVTATLQNNKCQLQILKNGNALLEIKENGGQKATVKITVNIPLPPKKEEVPVKEPVKEEVPAAPEAPAQPVAPAPVAPPSLPSGGEAAPAGGQPTGGEATSVPSGSAVSGGSAATGGEAMISGAFSAPVLKSIKIGKTEIAAAEKFLPSTAIITLTLSGYISDQDWQRGIKEGRVLIQSDPITQIFIPQGQNWSYTTKVELSFGSHQSQVAFVDQAGNVSPWSAPQIFDVAKPACGDGVDNDGDLQIDYPADIGCESLIDNNEKNSLIVQIMAIPTVAQVVEAAKPVTEAIKPVVEVLDKKVLNNPVVEKANETYAAPAVAIVAVANASTAVASASLLSYLQLGLQYLQAFFSQPLLLLFKRKRKGWGVVYNALTKLPIDLTTVRLIDAVTGRVVQTRVTDKAGRYAFFISQPGAYRLTVTKTGFIFPTNYLKSKSVDIEWLDLYHDETIEVKTKGEVITRNIPVDPEEKTVVPEEVIKGRRKLRLQHGVSLAGFFFSVGSLAVSPTTMILALLAVHIVTYILFRRLSMGRRPKNWGVVFDAATKKPLGLAMARIFETQYDKLLEAQITDNNGRYAFLVGRSQYYVTFEKTGYQPMKTEVIDLTAPEKEAVVGMDVGLKKVNQ